MSMRYDNREGDMSALELIREERVKQVTLILDPQSTPLVQKNALERLRDLDASNPALCPFYALLDALEHESRSSEIQKRLSFFDTLLTMAEYPPIYAEIVLNRAILVRNGWVRTWTLVKSIVFVDQKTLQQRMSEDNFWRILEMGLGKKFVLCLASRYTSTDAIRMFSSWNPENAPSIKLFFSQEMIEILDSPKTGPAEIRLFRRLVRSTQVAETDKIFMVTFKNLVHLLVSSKRMSWEMLEELGCLMSHFEMVATATQTRSVFQKIQKGILMNGFLEEPKIDTTINPEDRFHDKFGASLEIMGHARLWWFRLPRQSDSFQMLQRISSQIVGLLREPVFDSKCSKLVSYLHLLREHPPELAQQATDVFFNADFEAAFFDLISEKIPALPGDKTIFWLNNTIFTPIFVDYYAERSASELIEKLGRELWSQQTIEQLFMNLMTFHSTMNDVGGQKRNEAAENFDAWLTQKEPSMKEALYEKAKKCMENLTIPANEGIVNLKVIVSGIDHITHDIKKKFSYTPTLADLERPSRFLPGELALAQRRFSHDN